jgi:hypothetical protein
MSISKKIESKYLSDIEDGHHKARIESWPFFTRLVEDLTFSDVMDYHYYEEAEVLVFLLANYDKVLRINIYGDSLQACTRDIVMQTQAFISRNERY